jgi:hypothetical protein
MPNIYPSVVLDNPNRLANQDGTSTQAFVLLLAKLVFVFSLPSRE